MSCKQRTLDFYNYFTLVKSNQNILRDAVAKNWKNPGPPLPCKTEASSNDPSSGIQYIELSGSSGHQSKGETLQKFVILEAESNMIKSEQDDIGDGDFDHLYKEEFLEEPPIVKLEEGPKFKQPFVPKRTHNVSKPPKAKHVKSEVVPKKYNKKGQKGHRSCDLCGASYEYRELLVTHMKRRHIFEDVECNVCHKKFDNKVKLQSHTAHHNKKHMCEICSKSYVSPNQLKRHMQVHKIVSNDFICSKCGEGFATRNLLADHVRKLHDGDDEGQLFTCMCDICGKKVRFSRFLCCFDCLQFTFPL